VVQILQDFAGICRGKKLIFFVFGVPEGTLDQHGSLQDLGGSLGGNNTGAFVVNDDGQAVGFASFPGDTTFHATLWRHVGEMTDIGAVGNDPCSYATGINAKAQVVGASLSPCNGQNITFRSFLWEDGSIVDLNALIPPGSGLHLGQTYTINDRGEIAGTGADNSENDHAFLLIPCDENHRGMEGCDYSLVDPVALPQSASPRNPPSETRYPSRSRRTNRYQMPGLLPPSR
jgi:probable HAF family extracellular repeat protein